MKQSNLVEFELMSADELWILARAILSIKLDAEKHELERRLAQLVVRIEHKQERRPVDLSGTLKGVGIAAVEAGPPPLAKRRPLVARKARRGVSPADQTARLRGR